MPRNICYGMVGIGTELNPPIIRVIDQTTIPVNGNISGALSPSGSPVPPVVQCFGRGTGNITLVVSGVTACPNGGTLPELNGTFTLPFDQFFPASGGTLAFCFWLLTTTDPAAGLTITYGVAIFSDGTVEVVIGPPAYYDSGTNPTTGGGNYNFGDVTNNIHDLPCDGSKDGYGGSATASF